MAYNQSVTVSIKAMLHSRLMVTVLFDESIPGKEMDDLTEGLFISLNLLCDLCQKEIFESKTDFRSSHMHEMFMIVDLGQRDWHFFRESRCIIYRETTNTACSSDQPISSDAACY